MRRRVDRDALRLARSQEVSDPADLFVKAVVRVRVGPNELGPGRRIWPQLCDEVVEHAKVGRNLFARTIPVPRLANTVAGHTVTARVGHNLNET